MSGFLEQRLGHCLRQMAEKGLEALLVTHLTNSYYLTGFSGTAATVLITAKRHVLITDSRYTLLAKASVEDLILSKAARRLRLWQNC
ncbi:aminopeptidase P family N-terminal domain-containing protein [Streptococcus pyogenes]|nr:aminopeptidase P family N-terminal domain-containing protein [Streptococcus pyogenes]